MRHWRYKQLYWDFDTKQWEWRMGTPRNRHQCNVKGCSGLAELRFNKGRKVVRCNICSKCKRRRWRYNNPLYYMFSELRWSAKRRDIPFTLHYGEFIEFCFSNQLYRVSPKFTKDSLTVDRLDPTLGYDITNIRVITMQENCKANRKYQTNKYQPSDNLDESIDHNPPTSDDPF